ncbi:lactate dehydrogenase [Streptomyces sp. WZ.A104]|uniref:lactate/malate family dehydrogenase n=1 Tax=Streptomyces sp. WZ.A104 TaxID=2023771 RepID=UPI000BBC63DB|nr:lactate dehydrogenase [Streptomyces sp. WZ.A104]PCG85438.1 lactate dehydrogenase [Streptomyces sp. WZ.A104]
MTDPGKTIGIVGAGAVGHTLATVLTVLPWCSRLLVASGSRASARALVTDVEDMAQVLGSPLRVEAVKPSAMTLCDAIVICPRAPFTNTSTTEIRMAGLVANAPVIAALGRQLTSYEGTVIVVTNPVDVMTRLFTETSRVRRVYGVGSATDSARYRLTLARLLAVPVERVAGRVVGEHGDAAVVCASTTRVASRPTTVPLAAVHEELSARPRRINAGLGRTRCGPAGAVLAALTHTLGLVDGTLELSAVNPSGSCLGTPLQFTAGVPTVAMPDLSGREQALLAAADQKTRTAYQLIAHHAEGADAS